MKKLILVVLFGLMSLFTKAQYNYILENDGVKWQINVDYTGDGFGDYECLTGRDTMSVTIPTDSLFIASLTSNNESSPTNFVTVGSNGFIKRSALSTLGLPTNTNLSGTPISITKFASGVVTPSTGNGYSISISGVGFSNVLGYSIIPIKNTSTPTSVPKVAVKSVSTSAIVVNIIEGNASLVTILGFSVLQGVSEQFVNTTGLTLQVMVWGN